MRNLILVVVILQLVAIIIASKNVKKDYDFGDIIAFNRGGVAFVHFAIYVGKEPIDGVTREDNQDIFHFNLPEGGTERKCIFGELANETGERGPANYFDGKDLKNGQKIRKGSDQEIKDRIKAMMDPELCKQYNLFTNNCEHLATAVRYGWKVTNQKGTFSMAFCWWNKPEECKELNEAVEKIVIERMNCRRHNA